MMESMSEKERGAVERGGGGEGGRERDLHGVLE